MVLHTSAIIDYWQSLSSCLSPSEDADGRDCFCIHATRVALFPKVVCPCMYSFDLWKSCFAGGASGDMTVFGARCAIFRWHGFALSHA